MQTDADGSQRDDTLRQVVALYADVTGSTRLYERCGDVVAQADIAACLRLLVEVAERHGGRLAKTIGDEVLCLFARADDACDAAVAMHEALRAASAAGRFASGALTVKIGWHLGLPEWRDGELVGITPAVARQVIGLARAEEILASGAAVAALRAERRAIAQPLDPLESVADGTPLQVYRLAWESGGEVTQFRRPVAPPAPAARVLILRHDARELRLDAAHPRCVLGREGECDLATGSRYTSRLHGRVELRHGRFVIVDESSNGTVVARYGAEPRRLHREEGVLEGEGEILCGALPSVDPAATVRYRCE